MIDIQDLIRRFKVRIGIAPRLGHQNCHFDDCEDRVKLGTLYCPEHSGAMDSVTAAREKISAGVLDAAYSVECHDCEDTYVVTDDIGAGHPETCDACGSDSTVTTELPPLGEQPTFDEVTTDE